MACYKTVLRRMMVDFCVFPSHLVTLMPDYLWYISVQPKGTDQMLATDQGELFNAQRFARSLDAGYIPFPPGDGGTSWTYVELCLI